MSPPLWSDMDGLVRVVALGFEGLRRYRPHMPISLLMEPSSGPDEERIPIGDIQIAPNDVFYGEKRRFAVDVHFYKWENLIFRASWLPSVSAWRTGFQYSKRVRTGPEYPSQKDVERAASAAFTYPYRVERVSDTSIAAAKRLLDDVQRETA